MEVAMQDEAKLTTGTDFDDIATSENPQEGKSKMDLDADCDSDGSVQGEHVQKDILNLKVLIFGLGSLGVQVAKGLIQGGVRNLTFYNDLKIQSSRLSSQKYLTPTEVFESISYSGVNLTVRTDTEKLKWEILREHQIVVLTEFNSEISLFCQENRILLLHTQTNGIFGRIAFEFADPLIPSACHAGTTSAKDGKKEFFGEGKISLRLFEASSEENPPTFVESPASTPDFVPTIHTAYNALSHSQLQVRNPLQENKMLVYETFAGLVSDLKPPNTEMHGKLLVEFADCVDARTEIPHVNEYIGRVGAQEILKFWIKKSQPVYQLLYLYGGKFRFPLTISKVSCDLSLGGLKGSKDEGVVQRVTGAQAPEDENVKFEPAITRLPTIAEVAASVALQESESASTHGKSIKKGKNSSGKKKVDSKNVAGRGEVKVPDLTLQLPPPINPSNVSKLYGRKGIQLRSNSCYMDSTLFSMFCCTNAFDEAVLTPRVGDIPFTGRIKHLLQDIVNKLREDKFVSGDVVMKFREALVKEGHFTRKLLGTFMDPEEFFYILFNKALDLPRFFTYNTGHGDFAHQIFLPKSQGRPVATVQDLFEASMKYSGDLKLERVPDPAFLILMPRSNGSLVGYQKIIPNLELDLTGVMTEPRRCLCGKDVGIIACSLCPLSPTDTCITYRKICESQGQFIHDEAGHKSKGEPDHRNSTVTATHEFTPRIIRPLVPNLKMKLVAVVCVAGYHYTSFVRCGEEWLYFDSMGPSVSLVDNCSSIISKAEANLTKLKGNWNLWGYSRTDRIFKDCQYCIYEPQD